MAVVHSGELPRLLEASGIDAGFEGSLTYDLLVREDQVVRAKEVLRTNHLVLEGKVVLNAP